MPKTRAAALTGAEIEAYLKAQDDFALEMQIYSQVTALGFAATHGGTYDDPATKKPRQYDIRAHIERADRRVDLAIECKALKPSYPLVVSRVPRIAAESFHDVICSLRRERGPLSATHFEPSETVTLSGGASVLYPFGEPVGKATAQVGLTEKGEYVSGDTDVYDKWTQALSSLADPIANAAWYRDRSEIGFYQTVLFPLLVVPDGTLWAADYDTQGALQGPPIPVDEVTIFIGRDYGRPGGASYTVSHLHVLAAPSIGAFLEQFVTSEEAWEACFPAKAIQGVAGGD